MRADRTIWGEDKKFIMTEQINLQRRKSIPKRVLIV
jgi:hypothetical protein